MAADPDARMRILEMIESGEISAVEGLRRLEDIPDGQFPAHALPASLEEAAAGEKNVFKGGVALKSSAAFENSTGQPETVSAARDETFVEEDHAPHAVLQDAEKWRRWQRLPLWIGLGVTLLTLLGMAAVVAAVGVSLLFLCLWIPFLLGLLLVGIGWFTQDAPWLHLRVQQKPGETPQRIAFSFPLPVRPLAWLMRNFGHMIPDLQEISVDEILLALGETTSPDNPIYIQVDEGEDGEKVEIFIG